MGDLSDLPNFKRPWYRRTAVVRALLATLGALLGLLVYSFAGEIPEGLQVKLAYPAGNHALIGGNFAYRINIKNEDDKTIKVKVEVGFYAKDGDCIGKGAPLKNAFSLPQTLSVAPYESKTIDASFPVSETCEMHAEPRIFVNADREGQLSSATFPAEPIDVL